MSLPSQLRQTLKQKRLQLSPEEQSLHAQKATHHLLRCPWVQRPKHIALFISQFGELSTEYLFSALWERGHHLYLPVLQSPRARPMAFAPYTPQTKFKLGKFGILEPDTPQKDHRHASQLEVVIAPLVGFDLQGNRLGMGGGYYDRTFALKRICPQARPTLIGWAHQCQQVDSLPVAPWDVPLDALITEEGCYRF